MIISILFVSCTKSSSDDKGPYHITCDIDGKATSFNQGDVGNISYGSGTKQISLVGVNLNGSTSENFGIQISNYPSRDSIVTGNYTDKETRFFIAAVYSSGAVITGWESGTLLYSEATNAGVTLTNHFMLSLTEITAESIKGTFSGDFYYDGDPKGQKKTFTKGEFYVPTH